MSKDLKRVQGFGSALRGQDDAALIERVQKLRMLLPAFAEEASRARREVARLRSENAELKRRVAEFERTP
jgi:phage shock protein A